MQLDNNGELPAVYLNKLDTLFYNAQTTASKYLRYTVGNNPTIIDKPLQSAPDNRVPVPFARKIVRTMKGYMAKPGNITYKAEDEEYQSTLKSIFDRNDEELLTAELFSDALGNIAGYEILRVDQELGIRQYRIKPWEGIAVYDDTLAQNMIAFIHRIGNEFPDGQIEYVQTIYYANEFVEYRRTGAMSWAETDRMAHPFGEVPAVAYYTDQEHLPIYAPVIPLIDENDKIISSDYANELERFANAYLLALKKISAEVAEKAKEIRIFDNLGEDFGDGINNVTGAMAFLTKPTRGSDISEAADRFERLIYDQSMVINPNDDKIGEASGIALRYRTLSMEWLAADIEAYFSKGLQRRIKLISNALGILQDMDSKMVTISFRRNLPIDLDSIVTTAGNARGILSEKTILSLFPADIVPDPVAEQERLDEEASERLPPMNEQEEDPQEEKDQEQDDTTEPV